MKFHLSQFYFPLLVLISFEGKCQFFSEYAIIDDKDGYTNIRKDKNANSEIIGRLYDGDVFSFLQETFKDEWVQIEYGTPFNELDSAKKAYYNRLHYNFNVNNGNKWITLQGYIHRSRLIPIENLRKIGLKRISSSKNELSLKNDTISFSIKVGSFVSADHKIGYGNQGYPETIDGNHGYGTLGNIPRNEIKSISLKVNSREIPIPVSDFRDLFEPNLEHINLFIDKRNVIYISMPSDSDGAASYDNVWLVSGYKYLKRVCGLSLYA